MAVLIALLLDKEPDIVRLKDQVLHRRGCCGNGEAQTLKPVMS